MVVSQTWALCYAARIYRYPLRVLCLKQEKERKGGYFHFLEWVYVFTGKFVAIAVDINNNLTCHQIVALLQLRGILARFNVMP